ncbi:MAG: OST-HTH/LOTUS domain-containing protein, partial [Myxococcales bacterium]|nr:OST-HTH/LOTUS domain-containing protein [Myxococcales bacterium]
EFIYYDDLERKRRQADRGRKKPRNRRPPAPKGDETGSTSATPPVAAVVDPPPPAEAAPDPEAAAANGEDLEERRQQGLDHVLDVVEALFSDRDSHLWGSMVKQTLKRKRPNFSERFHGYRTFSELLEDAQKRGLLELSRDERSGGYLITSFGPNA